jgi:hypothetical protein
VKCYINNFVRLRSCIGNINNHVLRCVNNPEELNCGDLLEGVILELDELANGLRLNI